MPATAGRVRMPANNRVHSSAALQTHGIWQSTIRYDPYAPKTDDSTQKNGSDDAVENTYQNFQGLLQLAKITNTSIGDEARGACKKCGRVGHLTFQCRNFISIKNGDKDEDAINTNVLAGLEKMKSGANGKVNGKKGSSKVADESSDEEESESTDSDYDSEIERAIAQRYTKKTSGKVNSSKKKNESDDEDDSYYGERKKRGRSRKRSSRKRLESDSDDEDNNRRKRRKERRRRRDDDDESSDEKEKRHRSRKSRKEKRRRRSHHYSSDDSDESPKRKHKRRSRQAPLSSDCDMTESDDSRAGRDVKRSDKKSRKRYHEE